MRKLSDYAYFEVSKSGKTALVSWNKWLGILPDVRRKIHTTYEGKRYIIEEPFEYELI